MTWRLTGPISRALRERMWRLVDEVEHVSREEPERSEPIDEEQVAAIAGLALANRSSAAGMSA